MANLPPLNIPTLHEVEAAERAAQGYLQYCGDVPANFDIKRALRTLRASAVKIFEIQSTYYFSLEDADQLWEELIEAEVAASISGLLSDELAFFQEDIRMELQQTLQQHRKKWKPPLPKNATDTQISPSGLPPLPERLSAMIDSSVAAKRVSEFYSVMGPKQFAVLSNTSVRTLHTFRKTAKIRRDKLGSIATAMGTTIEELIKP